MALSKIAKVMIGGVVGLLVIIAVAVGVVLLGRSDNTIKLEFEPHTEGGSLILYEANNAGNVLKLTRVIDDFLQEYRLPDVSHRVACSPASHAAAAAGGVCDVSLDSFGPCTRENNYGYHKASPCIFLRLNKIADWIPDLYNTSESLPKSMPTELKQYIATQRKEDANTVWVSCEGEYPADVENIGPIQYLPRRGFPAYYYPFTNAEGYLSPLVAVYFEKPNTGILINVECRVWAKNIIYNREQQLGFIHLELMVDY